MIKELNIRQAFAMVRREQIPPHFAHPRNVYLRFVEHVFFGGFQFDGYEAYEFEDDKAWRNFRVDFVEDCLGMFNFALANMDMDHNTKMIACAYLLSKHCKLVKFPADEYETEPPKPPVLSPEERRARLMKEIMESNDREREAAEARQALIDNGTIILPEPGRPFELWLWDADVKGFKRIKTYRSHEATERAVPFNTKNGDVYQITSCHGDETTRTVLYTNQQ